MSKEDAEDIVNQETRHASSNPKNVGEKILSRINSCHSEKYIDGQAQYARQNNNIENCDTPNEYGYFIGYHSQKQFVTAKMLNDIGWGFMSNTENVQLINSVLEYFGITSGTSIKMFFATMMAESNGDILEDRKEQSCIDKGYTYNTRGAGYIQLTHYNIHDSFIKFVVDKFYPSLIEEYAELANSAEYVDNNWQWIERISDHDTASVIANNWTFTSAAWYWTGPQIRDNEKKRT